jgi:PAS domain S-box-containing protein
MATGNITDTRIRRLSRCARNPNAMAHYSQERPGSESMNEKTILNKSVREIAKNGSHLLIDNPFTGICITENGHIVFCNVRFSQILGFSGEELRGVSISKLFYRCEHQSIGSELSETGAETSPAVLDMVGMAKDGSSVYTRQSVCEFEYKGKRVAVWQVMDVTRQAAVQAHLQESGRRLRFLSNQVLQSQELERKRVARELHDGIGQILSSIKLGLELQFKELHENLPEEILVKLTGAVSGIQSAVEEVRRISMNLRPSVLDDLGIEAAVTWLCREFRSVQPSIELTHAIDVRRRSIGSALSVVIFRIMQEALNNIGKHAHATQVHVSLTSGKSGVTLSVKDNGCGFNVDSVGAIPVGFGIHSMKERAKLSGGHLRIYSVPGAGTELDVTWPRRTAWKEMAALGDDEGLAPIQNRRTRRTPGEATFRDGVHAPNNSDAAFT